MYFQNNLNNNLYHPSYSPEDLYSAATSGKPSWINYIGSMVAVVARVIDLHSAQQVHEGVVLCSQKKAFLTNRWGILDAVLVSCIGEGCAGELHGGRLCW